VVVWGGPLSWGEERGVATWRGGGQCYLRSLILYGGVSGDIWLWAEDEWAMRTGGVEGQRTSLKGGGIGFTAFDASKLKAASWCRNRTGASPGA
jgi:hypothetical protein